MKHSMQAVLIIVLLSTSATARTEVKLLRGNTLFGSMNASSDLDKGFVSGYVAGVCDALISYGRTYPNIPDNVTFGQLRDIVHQYLKTHPAKRHRPAVYLVFDALIESYGTAPTIKDLFPMPENDQEEKQ